MILQGDALSVLKTLPSESVDCIITSPPYWALRDYKTEGIIWDGNKEDCEHDFKIQSREINLVTGKSSVSKRPWRKNASGQVKTGFCIKCNAWKGQLGQEPTIDLYINHLIQVFNECKRILKKEGTCWVVLGDTYAGSGGAGGDYNEGGWKEGQPKYRQHKINLSPKSLCLIPERFALKMIENKWILRNKIIWYKPNCMPSSAKDRFTVDYENIYFFTKSQKYYFKTQYEQLLTKPHKPGNKLGIEHIDEFKKGGISRRLYESIQENNDRIWGNPNGRIKRCVWKIATKPFPQSHFAVFPEELVEQCLDAGCPPNGITLDPFMGSGTVALVALKNAMNFVGIELNPDYIEMAMKRITPYLKQEKITQFTVK